MRISWLRRFFDLPTAGRAPASSAPAERVGDMVHRGAGMRPLEPGELTNEYRAKLRRVCDADTNVHAAWLAWITWPDAPHELLVTLELAHDDEHSVLSFVSAVDALGGPRCVASPAQSRPTFVPFYERGAALPIAMEADSACPQCGHSFGDHVLSASVSEDQVTSAADGSMHVELSSVAGQGWGQCPVPGCACKIAVRLDTTRPS